MLRQIVVDDERLAAAVHERLAHGAAGVGRQILHRRGVRGVRGNDYRVVHGAVLFEGCLDRRHLGLLLADGHVDAEQVQALLIDDGVDGDRRFAREPVADDQLSLPAADGNHPVDRLDARLHRRIDRLTRDHVRRNDLDGPRAVRLDGTLAVEGRAQRVDDSAQQRVAHRHAGDLAGSLDEVSLSHSDVGAHDCRAHGILFEVERQAGDAAGELQQLAESHLPETVDHCDAVADADDGAHLGQRRLAAELLDLPSQDGRDVLSATGHGRSSIPIAVRPALAVRREDASSTLLLRCLIRPAIRAPADA